MYIHKVVGTVMEGHSFDQVKKCKSTEGAAG
jgi:hypothetical protein